MTQLPQFNVLR